MSFVGTCCAILRAGCRISNCENVRKTEVRVLFYCTPCGIFESTAATLDVNARSHCVSVGPYVTERGRGYTSTTVTASSLRKSSKIRLGISVESHSQKKRFVHI